MDYIKDFIKTGIDSLSGKKTFLIGTAMIIYGLLGFFLKNQSQDEAMRFIFEGFGFIFLRKGVEKIGQPNI